jgi:hypothetical protein
VLGGIQPAVLDTLRARSRQVVLDDGLIDRFLFCYPKPPPAREETWRVLSPQAAATWRQAVQRLLGVPVARGKDGVWRPLAVKLSPEARAQWEAFTRRHVAEVNADNFPVELAGAWSKMRGYCGRLALVLHALDWATGELGEGEAPAEPHAAARREPRPPSRNSGPVEVAPGGCVERAARLVDYFKAHARKVYSALHSNPTLEGALRILEWLRRRPQVSRFTRSEVFQALRRRYEKVAQLDEPLALLVESGYLVEVPGGPPRHWQANPHWQRDEPQPS